LRNLLTNKEGHFQADRVGAKVDNFKPKGVVNKAQNARQKKRGRTVTPAILGEVPFGSLRIVHVAAVTTELEARGVHFPWLLPTKTGIRNLVALLKFIVLTKEEQKLDRKMFKLLSEAVFEVAS
jgi:hypothetical protein